MAKSGRPAVLTTTRAVAPASRTLSAFLWKVHLPRRASAMEPFSEPGASLEHPFCPTTRCTQASPEGFSQVGMGGWGDGEWHQRAVGNVGVDRPPELRGHAGKGLAAKVPRSRHQQPGGLLRQQPKSAQPEGHEQRRPTEHLVQRGCLAVLAPLAGGG